MATTYSDHEVVTVAMGLLTQVSVNVNFPFEILSYVILHYLIYMFCIAEALKEINCITIRGTRSSAVHRHGSFRNHL